MKAPTKRELNAKLVHYRQLAADRAKQIKYLSDELEEVHDDLSISMEKKQANPWQSQHGGKHYAELTIQPLQYTLGAMGYEAFKGACHNHVARYTTRKKDGELTQLKKARHILDLWIYESEKNGGGDD